MGGKERIIIHATSYHAVLNTSQRYLRLVVYMKTEDELLLISVFQQKNLHPHIVQHKDHTYVNDVKRLPAGANKRHLSCHSESGHRRGAVC